MSGPESQIPQPPPGSSRSRSAGGTENSWCRAVPGGTGITTLALLFSKAPEIPLLQNALHKLQLTNPILNSRLHFNPTTGTYSYVVATTPQLQIETFDLASTSEIIQDAAINPGNSVSDFHLILEHELNRNTWQNPAPSSGLDLLFASVYNPSVDKWVVTLRLHTSVCDRATAVSLLRELLSLMCEEKQGGTTGKEIVPAAGIRSGIEDYVPSEKGKKAFWVRGVDVLGYSLNSFRLSNLDFKDAQSPRSSQVIRLKLSRKHTQQILSGCQSRSIKLCGLLAAAGLLAARSKKDLPAHRYEKFAVVTLIDCRSILDPVLNSSDYGFYHSAILNTHDVNGEEGLWELAKRTHESFTNAKNNNKHFTDIADVNFLMCKAIENPGLTPSSSLRTALISVFEDLVIDHSNEIHQKFGLEDYMGCASSHGVGPSLAIFDTIKDDQLDCACVFPSPLHSREQIQELIEEMKTILVAGSKEEETN